MPLPEVCFHHAVHIDGKNDAVFGDNGEGMEKWPYERGWKDTFFAEGDVVGVSPDGRTVVHTHEDKCMVYLGIPVKNKEE